MSGLIWLGRRFAKGEAGASSIEYAIIAVMLSLVVVVAVNSIGTSLNTKFDSVSNGLKK